MEEFIKRRSLKPCTANRLPSSAFLNLSSYFPYKNSCPVFSCRFNTDNRFTNIFAYTKEDGQVCLGDTLLAHVPDKENIGATAVSNITVKTFQAEENAIFDCDWRPSHSDQLLLASGDGSISLWNISENTKVSTFRGHSLSIRRLSVCPDEPHMFATGGRDGCIRVWDIRLPSKDDDGVPPVRTISNAHAVCGKLSPNAGRRPGAKRRQGSNTNRNGHREVQVEPVNSVTAVMLHQRHTVISGSDRKSDIRFWDLRKIYSPSPRLPPTPAHSLPPPSGSIDAGFTCFATESSTRHTLYASRRDNVLYAYSLTSRSTEPIRRYFGSCISSYYIPVAVCPTSPYLLCGSREGSAMIWSIDSSHPSFVLNGHMDEVCAVDWNDRFELLTFSGDSWRLWKLHGGEERSFIPTLSRCKAYEMDTSDVRPMKRTRLCNGRNENVLSVD